MKYQPGVVTALSSKLSALQLMESGGAPRMPGSSSLIGVPGSSGRGAASMLTPGSTDGVGFAACWGVSATAMAATPKTAIKRHEQNDGLVAHVHSEPPE